MIKKIIYLIKRQKLYYYVTNIVQLLIPFFFYRKKLDFWLKKTENQIDKNITERVNYYINTQSYKDLQNFIKLKNFIKPKHSLYFFDLIQITKYFSRNFKIAYKFGDVTENQKELTIVKSRPINHTGNSVLMKLDSHRHFNFFEDKLAFINKKNMAVWRGEAHTESRRVLVQKYHNHPLCDIGEAFKRGAKKNRAKKYLTIKQQLDYKFVISVEGVDVATNLKWILNSNSLCFMAKPKYETWFMEGKLIPDFHYVLLDDDYNNLIEKINYYTKNPNKALKIIKNANEWTSQFKDEKREKIISISVLNEYFKKTKQKGEMPALSL